MSSLFGELICGVVDPLVVKLGFSGGFQFWKIYFVDPVCIEVFHREFNRGVIDSLGGSVVFSRIKFVSTIFPHWLVGE